MSRCISYIKTGDFHRHLTVVFEGVVYLNPIENYSFEKQIPPIFFEQLQEAVLFKCVGDNKNIRQCWEIFLNF